MIRIIWMNHHQFTTSLTETERVKVTRTQRSHNTQAAWSTRIRLDESSILRSADRGGKRGDACSFEALV